MQTTIEKTFQNSNSLEILQNIISSINERSFHQHTHILYDLRTILGEEKKVYCEIGSYCGASASLILQHDYPTEIHCIDPLNLKKNHYNGYFDQFTTLKNNLEKFNKNNYEYHIHKNFSTDKNLINKFGQDTIGIDMLFIDGDHSYRGVKNDFYNFEKYVNKGGFIIFDDYLDKKYSPQVRLAVDDIVKEIREKQLPYELIGSLPNYKNAPPILGDNNLNEYILNKY